MTYPLNFAGRSLVALLLIATGLSTFGCGDSATISEPAELGNLSVSEGELRPAFTPATTSYTVQLSPDKSSTTITASPRVAGDTIRIDNQPTMSQTVTLGSPGAEQSVSIVVTDSGAGGASKSYTVRVRRDAEDNSLLALSVSTGILSPSPFEKDTFDYTVNGVASSATRITISATKSDPASIMQIDSVTVPAGTPSGEATVDLGTTGSTTPIEIVISRPSGTSRTYNVSINRGPSDNNDLGGITISPGSLSPAFRANRTAYTVNLPATLASNVTSVRITPRLQDATATMTVNGTTVTSGQAQTTPLPAPGSRVSNSIIVIAQNNTSKIYTVDVVRDALGGNNNLSALTVRLSASSPNLISFSPNTTSYTVDVASTVTSIRVTPTLDDTAATLTVTSNGPGPITTSGQARTIPLRDAGFSTTITILVTAPNGSQKPYTINVDRATPPPPSGNNNLSALTVRLSASSPNLISFSPNTTSYTVDVASTVTSIRVTPTLDDTAATLTVTSDGPGPITTSGQARTIPLRDAGFSTTITILVTAPNGSQKPYTINVDRATPPPPSGNNNLQNLTVSLGTLAPPFDTNRVETDYAVNGVSSSATSITVIATPQDSSATVEINNQGGNSRSIPLTGGPSTTEIEVRVIAPNGDAKTYSILVDQPEPAKPPTPVNPPDLIREDDSCSAGAPPDECAPPTTKEDNITNVQRPRFLLVPEPAAEENPKLYVDGVEVEATFNRGTSRIRPTSPLAASDEGLEHSITYKVTKDGVDSDPSPPLPVTINTGDPGAPTGD